MPSKPSNHRMIRVPAAVAERLDRIATEMLAQYEQGRTSKVEITDQGNRGCWVPAHAVITRALDELEDKQKRSKASKARAKRKK